MLIISNVRFGNPFHATGIFLYPLKTSENLWFSDIFKGYRKKLWHEMGWLFKIFRCVLKYFACVSKYFEIFRMCSEKLLTEYFPSFFPFLLIRVLCMKCWTCFKELNLFMRQKQVFLYFLIVINSFCFCNALI